MLAEPYLASPGDLSAMTGLPANDSGLILALKRASARFRAAVDPQALGAHFITKVEDDERWVSGNNSDILLLPAFPIVGDVVVEIDGQAVTDFDTGRASGVLRRKSAVWPDGLENIKVTFTHGWDTVPDDIQDAVLEQAAMQASHTAVHITQETALGNSVTYNQAVVTGVTQKWSDAVAKYRLGSRA